MTNKHAKIFSIIIVLIFIIALANFIGNIIYEISYGTKTSVTEFETLVQEITFSAEQNKYESQNFIDDVKKAMKTKTHISAITLTANEKVFFAYPLSSEYMFKNENNEPVLSTSSPMVKNYTKIITPLNNTTLLIQVTASAMSSSAIFLHGRTSFVLILVATMICIVVLFLMYKKVISFSDNDDLVKEYIPIDEAKEPDNQFEDMFNIENDIAPEYEADDFESDITEEIEINEQREMDHEITPESHIQESDKHLLPPILTHSEDPTGLFSETTGFGWQSYFEPRLDAELMRAASSEQDLALFYIEIENLHLHELLQKDICSVILDFFKFRDLIFENGLDRFSCILQNTDLSTAMILGENIYAEISKTIKTNDIILPVAIGISNRSIRLISGSRIMEETAQALLHAKEEDGLPIVAYKVNPEKYRQYLTKETSRLQEKTTNSSDSETEIESINS